MANIEYTKTEKFREIRKKAMKGENNPRWNGGNSQYPNHAELKRIRIEILKRTKGRCEICGKIAKIVHHIDGDKGNQSIDNLMALCRNCHIPLHQEDDPTSINKGRPTKYGLIYGMPLKKISRMFGVTPATIYNWYEKPEKKIWLEAQLKKIIE